MRVCDAPDMRVCDAPDMGIAGFVAETGEAYKAEEAYADARYHAKFDRAWSFQVVHNMSMRDEVLRDASVTIIQRDTSVTNIETLWSLQVVHNVCYETPLLLVSRETPL